MRCERPGRCAPTRVDWSFTGICTAARRAFLPPSRWVATDRRHERKPRSTLQIRPVWTAAPSIRLATRRYLVQLRLGCAVYLNRHLPAGAGVQMFIVEVDVHDQEVI